MHVDSCLLLQNVQVKRIFFLSHLQFFSADLSQFTANELRKTKTVSQFFDQTIVLRDKRHTLKARRFQSQPYQPKFTDTAASYTNDS